ncbi:MAG: tetratricopeptide repeat protein [Pyrinomonadaceae bacterium]
MSLARKIILTLAAIGLSAAIVFGIRAAANRKQPSADVAAARPQPESQSGIQTPADARIQAAQELIRRASTRPGGYNQLAAAYMQKARETGDFSFNARAEAALDKAAAIAPDDYDALKLRAKLLLTYHRFEAALNVARHAQAQRPDDHDVYGALTDALVELGRYEEAVAAAQRMVDLRPDSAAYARVSYLRRLHGDTEGALEAMAIATKAADPGDPEGRAWCYVQLGDELMQARRPVEADSAFDKALLIFPGYHEAFKGKARAAVTAGDLAGAIEWYRRAQERVPLPDTAAALGDIYAKLGRRAEAQHQYEMVEFIERAGGAGGGTYSNHLALFWADHDVNLGEALAVAQRERATRADIYTCDTLAWCLYKNRRSEEAKSAIDEATRLGTHDARINYHAALIYDALGKRREAANYFKRARVSDSSLDVLLADAARQTLGADEASDQPARAGSLMANASR